MNTYRSVSLCWGPSSVICEFCPLEIDSVKLAVLTGDELRIISRVERNEINIYVDMIILYKRTYYDNASRCMSEIKR